MDIRYKKVKNQNIFGSIFIALGVLYSIAFFFISMRCQITFYHYILISVLFLAVGIYQFTSTPTVYIKTDHSEVSVRRHHIFMKKIAHAHIEHIYCYDTHIEIVHHEGLVKIWFKYLNSEDIHELKTQLEKTGRLEDKHRNI